LGRLSSEDVQRFLDRYRDPEEARRLLMEMGMIDEHGELTPPYKKPLEEPEEPLKQWRSEGRSVLFF
jgi:hypothetical protein